MLCFSWVAYEETKFKGNKYVLEQGEYPNTEAMGLLSSDSIIRSVQTTGHVCIIFKTELKCLINVSHASVIK